MIFDPSDYLTMVWNGSTFPTRFWIAEDVDKLIENLAEINHYDLKAMGRMVRTKNSYRTKKLL